MGSRMGERTGYLTEQEVAAIQTLHKKAPYAITGISHGIFSLARRSGGMTFEGCQYVYVEQFDECVRSDVHARVEKSRRKAAKAAAAKQAEQAASSQGKLDI